LLGKETITVEAIKNLYLGVNVLTKTILDVFAYHNKQVHALLNKDYAVGTFESYETALNTLAISSNGNTAFQILTLAA
jgi:hypothetical protein